MKLAFAFPLLLGSALAASAQIIPTGFNSGDTTSFDGWANISAASYPGYGTFPGSGPWPGPIGSNVSGSGDADLVKVGNGSSGGPFVATSSVYFGGFSLNANAFGGTVGVTDTSVLSGVKTIVFQIQIGEASGYDFYNGTAPTLVLNGSTPITLTYSGVINNFQNGTFTNPETSEEEPVYVNTWGFQWDTSGFTDPITSLSIQFSGVQHSQVYALQLDQSTSVYNASLVPEPSTGVLLGCAGAALFLKGCRRRKATATVPPVR